MIVIIIIAPPQDETLCRYVLILISHVATGWNSFANLLYVDQPAGTGFSYVSNPLGYVTNERTIGTELWTMIQEFYHKYPKYAQLDLYIVGESYGKKVKRCGVIVLF